MDWRRAYLVVELDSFVDVDSFAVPPIAHVIVNEVIPADGTLHIFARQPDNLQCFLGISFPQQIDSAVCQRHGILQPTQF